MLAAPLVNIAKGRRLSNISMHIIMMGHNVHQTCNRCFINGKDFIYYTPYVQTVSL